MPGQQRAFLADDTALVPGDAGRTESGKKIDGLRTVSCPPFPPFFGLADADSISPQRPDVAASGGKRTNSVGLPRWPDGTRLRTRSTCVAVLIRTGADRHSDRPNGGNACALARFVVQTASKE